MKSFYTILYYGKGQGIMTPELSEIHSAYMVMELVSEN